METLRYLDWKRLLKRLNELTDNNQHTDALMEAATFFQCEPQIHHLIDIVFDQLEQGYLSVGNYLLREECRQEVRGVAKQKLPSKLYKQFISII